MKYLNYILSISAFVALGTAEAAGCAITSYHPAEYVMYRVLPEQDLLEYSYNQTDNLLSWQSITSPDIPLEDIHEIVYTATAEDIMLLREIGTVYEDNRFAEWIVQHDREILDFLYLATVNEMVRFRYLSNWYYPTMEIDAPMDLPEIIRIATSNNTYLRNRYLLQAVRALTTLGEYAEIIELWNDELSSLPEDDLMRKMALSYVAGAMSRFDDYRDRAIELFIQIGDVESVLYIMGRTQKEMTDIEIMELIFDKSPNSPLILDYLSRIMERSEYRFKSWYTPATFLKSDEAKIVNHLLAFSERAANDTRVDNPSVWHYTSAMLQIFRGEMKRASQSLSRAEQCRNTPYLDESIRVMRIYLDAQLRPCDESYQEWLVEQVKWFEQKIAGNITDDVREDTMLFFKQHDCYGFYYWNDMMRHILLSVACPRLVANGYTVRALQLANISCYMLVDMVDECYVWNRFVRYDKIKEDYVMDYQKENLNINQYRRHPHHYNNLDFKTAFFIMADTTDVSHLEEYYRRTYDPESETDTYLNLHSYTDKNFLRDIIGTRCIRQMEYSKAEHYLAKVDVLYDRCLNVAQRYNPFSFDSSYAAHTPTFRYDFAKQMALLEQKIATETDADQRAKYMMEYATGLRTSFGRCWQLGFYYYGYVDNSNTDYNDKQRDKAFARYGDVVRAAIDTAEDSELKAEFMYRFGMLKSVAELYPYTDKGQLVRGECDHWVDYQGIENTWKYW